MAWTGTFLPAGCRSVWVVVCRPFAGRTGYALSVHRRMMALQPKTALPMLKSNLSFSLLSLLTSRETHSLVLQDHSSSNPVPSIDNRFRPRQEAYALVNKDFPFSLNLSSRSRDQTENRDLFSHVPSIDDPKNRCCSIWHELLLRQPEQNLNDLHSNHVNPSSAASPGRCIHSYPPAAESRWPGR